MGFQGTIVAQIAITALSLMDLSNTHWAARGLFTFSLVSSIIAVYYAGTQHRVLGRCSSAKQVKAWIENEDDLFANRYPDRIQIRKPAVSSILTISAPVLLLSAALHSFLAGFGVYLGHMWTKGLDEDAGQGDSRNVFLVYAIGLGVCYGVFALSAFISRGNSTSGYELKEFLRKANLRRDDALESPQPQPRCVDEHAGRAPFTNIETNLTQALYHAATLRERSVEADKRVAELYRELGRREQPTPERHIKDQPVAV